MKVWEHWPGNGAKAKRAEPRTRGGGVWSTQGQGLMGTGRRWSLAGGRGQGHEGAEQGPRRGGVPA